MKQWFVALIVLVLAADSGNAQQAYQLAPPFITIDPPLFTDSALVTVALGLQEVELEVSQNGVKQLYKGPFYIHKTTNFTARARATGFDWSEPATDFALQANASLLRITEQTSASIKYPDAGNELNDLKPATASFQHPGWVGFGAQQVTFSFETNGSLQYLGYSFLRDLGSWIGEPAGWSLQGFREGALIYEASDQPKLADVDAATQRDFVLFRGIDQATTAGGKVQWKLTLDARKLPEGHPGAGKPAWIFVDEIVAY